MTDDGLRSLAGPSGMAGASISLEFRPHIELITSARAFVSEFYDGVLQDPDAISRVALATHELLENVLKYSIDGRSHFGIEVWGAGEQSVLRIRVRNRTTPERAQEALRVIAEIARSSDPFSMYQGFVRQCIARKQGSGLGLARIVAEAELTVRCDILGDEVTITAEGPVILAGRS